MTLKIYRHSNTVPECANGAVVAIGNFDGVHKGHQKVIETAKHLAEQHKLPLVVLTFEPHPKTVFGQNVPVLTHFKEKAALLAQYGATVFYAMHFTPQFAQTTPEEFCQNTLKGLLQARFVCVGEGFRFGAKGAGTVATLEQQAEACNFEVFAVLHAVDAAGQRISSTRVRQVLAAGQVEQAAAMLGHPYGWRLHLQEDAMLNLVGDISTYAEVKKGVYWVKFQYTDALDGQGEDGEHPEILAAAVVGGKIMFPPVMERPGVPKHPVYIQLLEAHAAQPEHAHGACQH